MFEDSALPQNDEIEKLKSEINSLRVQLRLAEECAGFEENRDVLYHEILQHTPQGIVVRYAGTGRVYTNATALKLTGLTHRQLSSLDPLPTNWHTIRPDGALLHVTEFPTVVSLKTGQAVSNVIIGICSASEPVRWLSVNSNPLYRNDSTEILAVVSTYIDVSAQMLAEIALREQEARYRQAIRAVGGVVYELHFGKAHYTFMDESVTQLLGYSLEETTPKLISDITVAPEMTGELYGKDIYEASLLYRAGKVQTWSCDVTYRTKQDGVRYFSDTSVPLRNEKGDIYGCLGILQDITFRKSIEIALRESDERFRQMADNLNVGFWLFDLLQYRLVYVNKAFERLYSGSAESFYKDPSAFSTHIHPDDHSILHEAARRHWEGDSTAVEYRLLTPEGGVRWVLDKAIPLTFEDGSPYRVVGIMEDITERKALQAQLQHIQKMDSIGRLAGGIAHDFNNLLTIIWGFAELAQEQAEPLSPIQNSLNNIIRTTQRASRLTADLLSFARRQVSNSQIIDANHTIIELSNILRPILEEHIELVVRPTAQSCLVRIEPEQLEQVILNIAINARDAMPDGGVITLETEIIAGESPEVKQFGLAKLPHVRIGIHDTGTGIAPEIQEHIFEPFFTTKTTQKGTGLGLATSYGIITQHQGAIQFRNGEKEGVSFAIYLPLSAQSHEQSAPLLPKPKATTGANILLVEDDTAVSGIVAATLQRNGHRVWITSNGQEALSFLEAMPEPIHLVISDVIMPKMGGIELAKHLHALYPKIRTILTSGYIGEEQATNEVLQVADRFIAKPFNTDSILSAIESVLARVSVVDTQ